MFDQTDALTLDPDSLVYVVGELQNYLIHEANRDAIGDAPKYYDPEIIATLEALRATHDLLV